jgi:hypothetical protein
LFVNQHEFNLFKYKVYMKNFYSNSGKIRKTALWLGLAVLLFYCGKPQAQNVGITNGASITPYSLLHIHDAVNATGQLFQLTNTTSGTGAATNGFGINLNTNFNVEFKNQYNNAAAGISFFTNNGSTTEKMRLLNNGNFGVGTSSSDPINYFNLLTLKGKASFSATGTVATTASSATVTGTGTDFLNQVSVGDYIVIGSYANYVSSVASATSLTCVYAWSTTVSGQTMTVAPSVVRIDRNSGTKNIIIDYFGDVGINQMYPFAKLHVTETNAGYNPLIVENTAASGTDLNSDAIVAYTIQSGSAALWGTNEHTDGTGIMAGGNNGSTFFLPKGSGGAFTGKYIGAWGREADSTTAGTNWTTMTNFYAGLSGQATDRIAADANMYRFGVYGRVDDNGAGDSRNSGGVLGFNNNNSTTMGSLGYMYYGTVNATANTKVLSGVYGQYSSDEYGMIGSSLTLYPNYFYHNQDAANDGQTSLFAFRTRSAVNAGASYAYTGVNSAVMGFNYWGDTYSFGVYGATENDVTRNGGVCGYSADGSWGALGYETSAGAAYYGGYFVGATADTYTGAGTGKIIKSDTTGYLYRSGIAAFGDLFGADIHGQVYGAFVQGNRYSLYTDGALFNNDLMVQLQKSNNTTVQKSASNDLIPLYASVSTNVTVQTTGIGVLQNGYCKVAYDKKFSNSVSSKIPVVINVTPMGECNGVFVQYSDDGFIVKELNSGNSNVQFSYMVTGTRNGYEVPELPSEVLKIDYLTKLNSGLTNDGSLTVDSQGLYYKDGQIYNGIQIKSINEKKDDSVPLIQKLDKSAKSTVVNYKKDYSKSLKKKIE